MQLKPGSFGFLALAGAAACLFAWAWAGWILPGYNSEYRGDIHHHALMVYEEPLTESRWPGFFDGYPRLSHKLTAQFLPLFEDDPYKALGALSLASVFRMLALPFTLWCRTH